MSPLRPYTQLFELLRQRNLSNLLVSRETLGMGDAVSPDVAQDLLRRADRSWSLPRRIED
ncbi:MAG: hypothetical protein WAO69_16410 [Aestuariivita sp.]|uniref:hypothetical protein n=1 Tax=Aestuariivita sp. TaxID=1872407 RepID=UPI003BB12040